MSYSNVALEQTLHSPRIDTDLYKLLLQTGNAVLNLQVGIVSKVFGSNYELIEIDGFAGEYKVGDILQIKSTYCRDVIATEITIALSEMQGIRGLQRHPLYKTNTLEAYIGAPIFFGGKIWGTINFSSEECRATDFSRAEIDFVDAYAGIISDSLSG
jgi:transcriptional regulator with GAF, ATPase, and Fis domain